MNCGLCNYQLIGNEPSCPLCGVDYRTYGIPKPEKPDEKFSAKQEQKELDNQISPIPPGRILCETCNTTYPEKRGKANCPICQVQIITVNTPIESADNIDISPKSPEPDSWQEFFNERAPIIAGMTISELAERIHYLNRLQYRIDVEKQVIDVEKRRRSGVDNQALYESSLHYQVNKDPKPFKEIKSALQKSYEGLRAMGIAHIKCLELLEQIGGRNTKEEIGKIREIV